MSIENLPPIESRPVTRAAILLAVLAFLLTIATLGDPGITSDEPIDVRVGFHYADNIDAFVRLYSGLLQGRPRSRDAIQLFGDNAQHPPLGRILLGISAIAFGPLEGWLGGPDPFSVHAARLAPAACFAILVGLLTLSTGRRRGLAAGIGAGLGLIAMPRVFAHGHFATLDTFLAFFWTLALLGAVTAVDSRRPLVSLGLAGILWGLALLTKIHAWLLPPFVVAWTFRRLPWSRAIIGLGTWTIAGLLVFLAGWPWLWFDTITRLRRFLGTSVDRLPLRVEYFGNVYLDREVPWHYPWVYFAVTVPLGLHLLGGLGVLSAWRTRRDDRFPQLLVAAVLFWLVLFSTGAPVYDGERLFLVAFPLWAILIGFGFQTAWGWAKRRPERLALVAMFLAAQGYGVVAFHPFQLSYYNALVGGLPGASRLGLERTYWGDAVDRVLLDALADRARPGETVALAPTLHHFQAPAATTSRLFERGLTIRDEQSSTSADWILVYRRTAYWSESIRELVEERAPILTRSRQGVWLSGLWRRRESEKGAAELKKSDEFVQFFPKKVK